MPYQRMREKLVDLLVFLLVYGRIKSAFVKLVIVENFHRIVTGQGSVVPACVLLACATSFASHEGAAGSSQASSADAASHRATPQNRR